MINYWEYDITTQKGIAAELYHLYTRPPYGDNSYDDVPRHYYYCDLEQPVDWESNRYEPLSVQRSDLELTSYAARSELNLTVRATLPLVQDILYDTFLPLWIEVRRVYLDNYFLPVTNALMLWRGQLKSSEFIRQATRAKLTFVPEEVTQESQGLRWGLTRFCPKVLYQCMKNKSAQNYAFGGYLTPVAGDTFGLNYDFTLGKTLPNPSPSQGWGWGLDTKVPWSIRGDRGDWIPGYFQGGKLRIVNTTITVTVDHVAVDPSPTVNTSYIRLQRRLSKLENIMPRVGGVYATLWPGCNHMLDILENSTFLDCGAKFNNIQEFGGFPFVNRKNPWQSSTGGRG